MTLTYVGAPLGRRSLPLCLPVPRLIPWSKREYQLDSAIAMWPTAGQWKNTGLRDSSIGNRCNKIKNKACGKVKNKALVFLADIEKEVPLVGQPTSAPLAIFGNTRGSRGSSKDSWRDISFVCQIGAADAWGFGIA
jgi:hypothetical protein